MNIYYSQEKKVWLQYLREVRTFGGIKQEILPKPELDFHEGIPFTLQLKDQHIGPLIGIMTSPKNEYSLAGNSQLFIRIQNKLLKENALSFIFSYEDVKEDGSIIGYIYLPSNQKWLRAIMPFPDIVYNRIPYRKSEQTAQFQQCLQLFQQYQIPVFNPGFIDKFDLFQILERNKKLKKFLPKTILVDSKEKLESFFNQKNDIYIKPRKLSKGKNIFRLSSENHQLILESNKEGHTFLMFNDFWDQYGEYFCHEHFIAQRSIQSALADGKRYDFRILAHYSPSKLKYELTGVGIRANEAKKITTHLANGGVIIPYRNIQTKKHDFFIQMIVEEIGIHLSKELGFFGEFSIDAGISSDGKYVLYEVNSKPMSFDEEEIEQKRIIHLCHLFLQKTGFENE
jgi:hypothetical protein